MKRIRRFICNSIFKDPKLYTDFNNWLKVRNLDIDFVLFDDEEYEFVLNMIEDFLKGYD